ncbi:MAG: AbrB/MazE/SpoVT family DNA-binding domain-containing protein [Chloroflexota bacterium]
MTERRLIRVQEKDQVTLPSDVRKKLGLKKGDLVSVTEMDGGVLITPQEVIATRALDRLGALMKEQGLDLDTFIEEVREDRGTMLKEKYKL